MSRPVRRLTLDQTSRLVARALGTSPDALVAAFRPADASDLEAVLKLRAGHTKTQHRWDDRGYLTWRYDFEEETRGNRLWIVDLHGEPVGILGTERQDLAYRGGDWEVHRLMDILVREDLMGSGLGVWMNLRLQQEIQNTICIGSTEYSHSIVTGLNRALPPWQTWRYPLRLREWRGLQVGLGAINLLLRGRRALRALGFPRGMSLVEEDVADPAMAELRRSMSQYCLMPQRSAEKARWRFDSKPNMVATYFKLRSGGRLIGQAVVVMGSPERADIFDILCLHEGDPALTEARLHQLVFMVGEALAAKGTDIISTRLNDPVTIGALSKAGFIYREEPCAIGYHFRSRDLAELMEDGVPLFLMPADADFD